MKKYLLLSLIFIIIISCRNKKYYKNSNGKKIEIIKNDSIKVKTAIIDKEKTINRLPFGYFEVATYPFIKNIWYNDDDSEILKITTTPYRLLDSIKKNKIIIKNLIVRVDTEQLMYHSNNKKNYIFKSTLDSIKYFYLLLQKKEYSLYYGEAIVKYDRPELFEQSTGNAGYLLTIKKNKLISFLKFDGSLKSKKDNIDEMWNYYNFKATYIDANSIITTCNFKLLEGDYTNKYKLITRKKYKINSFGKIIPINLN